MDRSWKGLKQLSSSKCHVISVYNYVVHENASDQDWRLLLKLKEDTLNISIDIPHEPRKRISCYIKYIGAGGPRCIFKNYVNESQVPNGITADVTRIIFWEVEIIFIELFNSFFPIIGRQQCSPYWWKE